MNQKTLFWPKSAYAWFHQYSVNIGTCWCYASRRFWASDSETIRAVLGRTDEWTRWVRGWVLKRKRI